MRGAMSMTHAPQSDEQECDHILQREGNDYICPTCRVVLCEGAELDLGDDDGDEEK